MKGPVQRLLHCPCGNEKILALGLCSTCYTLKRQDEEYFGGHREEVLARDGYRCRIPDCATLKRGKRSVAVHHRMPGNNDPKLMITLCLPCHAKVGRTQFLENEWPELLRILWREQHPEAKEQTFLDFKIREEVRETLHLFDDRNKEAISISVQTDKRITSYGATSMSQQNAKMSPCVDATDAVPTSNISLSTIDYAISGKCR